MAVFKCKMCGGTIEFEPGATVGVCEYCGTKQTLPRLHDDRRANLYDRANHFRRNNEFDKAVGIYEQILTEDTADAEAYWSLVLCRYGIEYVEDPATKKRVPTVNRAQFTSVFDDDNYKSALQYADGLQKAIYEAEANAINEIQKGILAISQKEEPFDVFICYKETDANGRRTPDSVLANDLYHQLVNEGFKVFFSRITLEDKLGTAYEPYIFAALNSAKVMVVLGTRPEHFNAVWVKNEWSRYLALVKQSGGKKVLIPAYRDMDPYDLPEEFSHLQAQDMSKLGFMQDLIRGIKKIVQTDTPKTVIQEKVITEPVVQQAETGRLSAILDRGFLALEDGEWTKADGFFEQALNFDAKNARAYLGKLMAELHAKTPEALKNCEQPFDKSNNYQKVLRFADGSLAETLKGYIAHINERNENARLSDIYNNAVSAMNTANTELECKTAAEMFKMIAGFKDSNTLARQCIEKAVEQRELAEQVKRKAQAIVRVMKNGIKSKFGLSLEERLAAAKTRVGYLECILNIFDEMQSQIQALQSDYTAAVAQEKQLADQRSRLGIFANKEKRRIDEELSVVMAMKTDIAARIEQVQKSIDNYTSVDDVERDLSEVRNNINDIETQIESARISSDNEYSFEEAINIYLQDSDVTDAVNTIFPAVSVVLYLEGKTNTFWFGHFVQKKDSSPEPIEWQVLARENGRMLVISRYALDRQEYNTSNARVTWETCSLRKWLNETFINAAFSLEEQNSIISTTILADKNPSFNTPSGNNTTDKIFLLSITEAKKYFSSDISRQCQGTAYCYAQGISKAGNGNCWWGLRSSGRDSDRVAAVSYDGSVYYQGDFVFYGNFAVRPAMWIDLEF